jgi:hypothetical protein
MCLRSKKRQDGMIEVGGALDVAQMRGEELDLLRPRDVLAQPPPVGRRRGWIVCAGDDERRCRGSGSIRA